MPVRKIIQAGEPSLINPSAAFTDIDSELSVSIQVDLKDTHSNGKGIGLAAPQIGENHRMFVTEIALNPGDPYDYYDDYRVYINPEITDYSNDTTQFYEGCLSVAAGDLYLPVIRPKQITVEAFDESGKKFRIKCDGLLARVIQHEYDHLDGILFLERVTNYKDANNLENYKKYIKFTKDFLEARKVTLKEITYL